MHRMLLGRVARASQSGHRRKAQGHLLQCGLLGNSTYTMYLNELTFDRAFLVTSSETPTIFDWY